MRNNNPSINPADEGNLAGVLRFVFSKLIRNTDDMLPAQVIAVSEDQKNVQVQPLIAVLTTDGNQVSRAQVSSIPVFQIGAGGFILHFPIKAGDLGWIKANDRDISLFLNSYSERPPNTNRAHSFSDAIFIPQVMTDYEIADVDKDNVVLQSLDGSVKISFFPTAIRITAPLGLQVDGNITATGDITPHVPIPP